MRTLSPLIGAYNPFLPEYRRDPHVTWKKLRENSPVFYSRGFGACFATHRTGNPRLKLAKGEPTHE